MRLTDNTGAIKIATGALDTAPIGSTIPYDGTNVPNGYLPRDGRAISRTTYANLFNVIGASFGVGDGTTTFNLPTSEDNPWGFSSFRNKIINGSMDIWQKVSLGGQNISDGNYPMDRWQLAFNGSGQYQPTQNTNVPTVSQSGTLFSFSMLIATTGTVSSLSAGNYYAMQQRIEGYNFRMLAQRPMVLSFWVSAVTTGTYCVAFRNTGLDQSCVMEFTVNSSATWEYKTLRVPASPSSGTWDYTNNTGLIVTFVKAAASSYRTTPGSWVVGNFLSTSNQVNGMASSGNDFYLTGVQLETGSEASLFEDIDYNTQLLRCMRYYEKTFEQSVQPANASNSTISCITAMSQTGTAITGDWRYKVAKRAAPTTVTTYNPTQSNSNWRNTGNTADATVSTIQAGSGSLILAGSSASSGNTYQIHATVEAELT